MGKLIPLALGAALLGAPALAQSGPPIPISALPAATPLVGPELFYVVQSGISKSIAFSAFQLSLLSLNNTWSGINTFAQSIVGHATLDLPLTGGALTGPLTLPAGTTGSAPLIFGLGVAPTSPTNGNMWFTTAGLFVRVGGVTYGPVGLPVGSSIVDGTTPYSGGTADGVVYNSTGVVGTTSAGVLGQALISSGPGVAPAYQAGVRTLLNTLTASNSATLTDIASMTASYSEYDIVFENIVPATNTVTCEIQVYSGAAYQVTSYVGGALFGNSAAAAGFAETTYIPSFRPHRRQQRRTRHRRLVPRLQPRRDHGAEGVVRRFGHPATTNTFNAGTIYGEWSGGNGAVTGFQVLFSPATSPAA